MIDVKHTLELIVAVAASNLETEFLATGFLIGGAAVGVYGTYKLVEKACNKLGKYFTSKSDKEAEKALRKLIKYMNSKEYYKRCQTK